MTWNALETAVVANHEVFMRTSDAIGDVLAEEGLTHATAQALWALDPDKAPPSMKELAGQLFCNAPNLSFVTKQLVDRGLVERSVDPDDRRSRVLTLTENGRRVRKTVIAATLEGSPLSRLDPEDQRRLAQLLAKVLEPAGDPT